MLLLLSFLLACEKESSDRCFGESQKKGVCVGKSCDRVEEKVGGCAPATQGMAIWADGRVGVELW